MDDDAKRKGCDKIWELQNGGWMPIQRPTSTTKWSRKALPILQVCVLCGCKHAARSVMGEKISPCRHEGNIEEPSSFTVLNGEPIHGVLGSATYCVLFFVVLRGG